jgi:tetratricopeptide (TPR) repeat protein/transcriptional regulator with XRE-family HTH domain
VTERLTALTLGDQLRQSRTAAGLTLEELAERSGLSVRAISDMERGRTIRPRRTTVEVLSRVLGLDMPDERVADQPASTSREGPLTVPRQLPAARQFVGRLKEQAALGAMASRAARDDGAVPIAAISGTAGVGKTALAVHWAHRAVAQFPDGQLYVNLRGFDPSGVPMAPAEAIRDFLDAFRVPPEQIPVSLAAQASLFRSLLAGKRILVILDNARDAEQVRPLLPGSPACAVIVTSRSQLTSLVAAEGAHPIALDLLTSAEARQLLEGRLGKEGMPAQSQAVGDVIELCARLPLALAVVTARVAVESARPLSALAAELRDVRVRLDALDAGDESTSLRTVFSWSYLSLSSQAARLFRLIGEHPGPDIAGPAAASLAGIGRDQAHVALTELTRANLLVEYTPGRFTCHDLLRAYAAERADAEDSAPERRAAIHRVLDHYLRTAHAAYSRMSEPGVGMALGPAQPGVEPEDIADFERAMAWLEAERVTLLAAISHAAEAGFDVHAWQLAAALPTFLDRRGYWHDHAAIQRIALASTRRLGDRAGQAYVLRYLGHAMTRLGAYEEAGTHYRHALDLYTQLGDHDGQARIHLGLAALFEQQGRYGEALSHCQQSLELYEAAGNQARRASMLNNIGWCHARLRDYRSALECCRQAVDLQRANGDWQGEAFAWDTIGYSCHQLGSHSEAIASYEQALALFRKDSDPFTEAQIRVHLGDVHRAAGDPGCARTAWRQALAILESIHHPDALEVRAKLDDSDRLTGRAQRA